MKQPRITLVVFPQVVVHLLLLCALLEVAGFAAGTPPDITTQPQSKIVITNFSASFNVEANSSTTLTYQWYKNSAALRGATKASYAIPNVALSDAGVYSVRLTNAVGWAISSNATLSVLVRPVASNDSYTTSKNTRLNVAAPGVLANDQDLNNLFLNGSSLAASLAASLVGNPSHGQLTLNANGSFAYTPATNYTGPDSFTYRVADNLATGNIATVSITVLDRRPLSSNDVYSCYMNMTLDVPATNGVLANDTDADRDALTARLVTGTSFGSVSLYPDGSFSYTPGPDYIGADVFTYVASDGQTTGNVASVTLIVTRQNRVPVAQDDTYSCDMNTTLAVAAPGVLENDLDLDNDPLTAQLLANASYGSVLLNSDGSFTYTPNTNYTGSDSFAYADSDGLTTGNVALVTISVVQPNSPPMATNDSYSCLINTSLSVAAPGVLANDTDPDSGPLTALLVAGPSYGSLDLNTNGAFLYTPQTNYLGSDSFTYAVSDGSLTSAVARVSLTIYQLPILTPVDTTNGFQFQISGPPQFTYVIQGSTDFVSWFPLETIIPIVGTFTFTDPATNYSSRFYRVKLQ